MKERDEALRGMLVGVGWMNALALGPLAGVGSREHGFERSLRCGEAIDEARPTPETD